MSEELLNEFTTINNSLTLFKMQINTLQQQVRTLEKNIKKELKTSQKGIKPVILKPKKAPSGFAKPTSVTKELCEFMNKDEGTEIARTEVTRALVAYIKTNNLENKTNSKFITPDEKLKFLLGLEEGQELTYFNIQKYMNKHFVKNVIVA